MRGQAVTIAVVALAGLPAVAHAAAAPTISAPDPCVVSRCLITVALQPSTSARMQVSFDHRGGEPEFRAAQESRCAPAASPDAIYARLPSSCVARARLRTAGSVVVAARVMDGAGATTFTTRTITVVARKTTPRTPRPRKRRRRPAHPLCRQAKSGDKCQAGRGRQTPGGGALVSHKGWPRITGVFWQVTGNAGRRFVGGPEADELLGHHGSDVISGRGGPDVLWGDWDPKNNNGRQRDVLSGGAGRDWIYSSHGRNTIRGGAGADYVWAYYGRGTIDCGPGRDTLRIKVDNRYRVRNCERIKNFCSHGAKPGGGCYKPGERPRASRSDL